MDSWSTVAQVRDALSSHLCNDCVYLANAFVKQWAPLLTFEERRTLWARPFVEQFPSSVDVLLNALSDIPEECVLLAEVLQVVLVQSVTSFEKVDEAYCSIPTRVSNACQRLTPDFFGEVNFFSWLSSLVVESEASSSLCGRIILLGHSDALARAVDGMSDESHVESFAKNVVVSCPRVERLVASLLRRCRPVRFFSVAGPLAQSSSGRASLESIMMKSLRVKECRTLCSLLCMQGHARAEESCRHLATAWSDARFVKTVDVNVQLQVARCIRQLLRACDVEARRNMITFVLQGIHARLGVTDEMCRRVGMALAEVSSNEMEGVKPVDFEDPTTKGLLEWPADEEENDDDDDDVKGKVVENQDQNPDSFLPHDDDDDDDSLSSYEMDDDEDVVSKSVIVGPTYLRDCLKCILDGRQKVEEMERGLKSAEFLIRSNPCDLNDVSISLTSALLHASDEFHLEGFSKMQLNSLVALCVYGGPQVVEYIGGKFCEDNWSIQQRLVQLECVNRAAAELCGVNDQQQQEQEQSELFHKPISDDGKTRRWGNALRRKKETTTTTNRLTKVAGSYFWPFIGSKKIHDALVAGRLLLHLGRVVSFVPWTDSKERMLKSLAEFVFVHRWSASTNVVRSCMVSLAEALLSVEADVLIQYLSKELDEAIHWYTQQAKDADDSETAKLANACASELAAVLKTSSMMSTMGEEGI